MCGGLGICCCFRLHWSALCYVRGYCYKLGLSLFFYFVLFVFVLVFFCFCLGEAVVLLRMKWL